MRGEKERPCSCRFASIRCTAGARGASRSRRRRAGPGGQRLPAAALADIGNIYGWGKWKRVAPAGGFKPIFGCELEIGGRRFVFLVKAREGYSNLMEIFNRKEIRDASGLVAITFPGGRTGRGER